MRTNHRVRSGLLCLLAFALLGLAGVPAGAAKPQQVGRAISLAASSPTAFTGAKVTFSGKLSKSPKGSKVKVQRRQGTSWTTLATVGTTTARGAYAAVATMPATPGTQQLRTVAPARTVTKNGKKRKLKKATSSVVTVTVTARPVTPVIATSTLPDGQVGEVYAAGLDLVTPMPGTWSVAPPLPAGLALDAMSGDLSGTPTAPGASSLTFSFTPTAAGSVASRTLQLAVAPASTPAAPTITTTRLPDGYEGVAYSHTLTSDDAGPGAWSMTAPPPGFALDVTSGELTVSSPTAGDYELVVRYTRAGDGLSDERTFELRFDPVPVPPAATVAVDGGGVHACRIKADATLWCWGNQGKGAVGVGDVPLTEIQRRSPEQVGTSSWLQVSAAVEAVQAFSCGIQADRSLWCWGSASAGQLGLGESGVQRNSPALVDDDRHWAQVSGGQAHACAITLGGRLFCWGSIATGLDSGGANVPTEVDPGGTPWTSVSAGGGHTCGVRADGTLWCWGFNSRGQLGAGGAVGESVPPLRIGTATDWTSVTAGAAHTCGLRGTALYCWGRNSVGAVGTGSAGADVTTPTQVSGGWAEVASSGSGNEDHTCAVDTAGRLWCWGSGSVGRLGNGSTDEKPAPTQVGTDTTWASVTAGGQFSCAVKADSSQWCWGGNGDGEVGVGSVVASFPTPQQLTS